MGSVTAKFVPTGSSGTAQIKNRGGVYTFLSSASDYVYTLSRKHNGSIIVADITAATTTCTLFTGVVGDVLRFVVKTSSSATKDFVITPASGGKICLSSGVLQAADAAVKVAVSAAVVRMYVELICIEANTWLVRSQHTVALN